MSSGNSRFVIARIPVLLSALWIMGVLLLAGGSRPLQPAEAGDLLQDTNTPTPSKTPTNTPTPTPTPIHADLSEPNDDFGSATPLSVGGVLGDLTFWPMGDIDYFKFWGKVGRTYQVECTVSLGVDSYMRVFGPAGASQLIGENDDAGTGNLGSRVIFSASEQGFYYIELTNRDPTDPVGRTYEVEVKEVPGTPSATPTPTNTSAPAASATPTFTPVPGEDALEPNYDFDHATVLATGVQYNNLNFVPWSGSDPNQPDNDFFRIWVKPGLFYICETLNLAAGTDTNMIFYFGPSFDEGGPGNDDRAPGDYSSKVSWYSNYIGWLYILVGPRWAGIPPDQLSPFTYSIKCSLQQYATSTPLPTSPSRPTLAPSLPTYTPFPTYTPLPTATLGPTRTPPAQSPSPSPSPTPQPIPLLIAPLPTTTPAGPTVQVMTLDVLIYYDANQNLNPELEEGVRDIAVGVYEEVGNELLAFGYTSLSGGLHFGPLIVTGAVRVEVPFFGYSRRVAGLREQLEIRIAPRPLPASIP